MYKLGLSLTVWGISRTMHLTASYLRDENVVTRSPNEADNGCGDMNVLCPDP